MASWLAASRLLRGEMTVKAIELTCWLRPSLNCPTSDADSKCLQTKKRNKTEQCWYIFHTNVIAAWKANSFISFMSVYHEWNSLVKRRIRRPRNILKLFSETTKHVGETTYGDSEQDVRETTRWQNDRSPIIQHEKKDPSYRFLKNLGIVGQFASVLTFPNLLQKNIKKG